MPSRAETRGAFESVLRALSVIIIAFMFWQSLDHGQTDKAVAGTTASLRSDLRDWSRKGIAPNTISAHFDSVPSPRERDWLAALNASGSKVTWSGSLPAVGLDVQPIAAPSGGYRMLMSAPSGLPIVVGDEIGPIDTVNSQSGGGNLATPSASGVVTATAGAAVARATFPDSLTIRRVLVIGDADWESKFVIAALEEEGWKVDSRTHLAPGVSVTQGSTSPIDTSRYSAVIALDHSASADAPEIVRYAASGGGVIIGAAASSLEGLGQLRAGTPGKTESASALSSEPGSITLASLSIVPINGLRGDAVVLDRRGGSIAAAARRFGGGRVVQLGYLDTWKWRMSGGENAVVDHRKWWTNAVAGVAYAPPATSTVSSVADNAPVAHLIETLGKPAGTAKLQLASNGGSISLWWLFVILSLSLLAEWVSRRTRGVR